MTYNNVFSQVPTFALLLSGFHSTVAVPDALGYDINYGDITTSGAQFNITNSGNALFILELNFRWVAAIGEHLQLFPIICTFASTQYDIAFTVPFDYQNKVVWSPGNFEVEVTSIVSSFHLPYVRDFYYTTVNMIAQWNGTGYNYNGHHAFVLDVNTLYGVECPFSNKNGVNVVNLFTTAGTGGSSATSFLLFHKVQHPNTDPSVTTGFGVIRGNEY